MSISVNQQVDYLWKKLIYGVTDSSNGGKQAYEEAIGSNLLVDANTIWAQSVPVPAPSSTTSIVSVYSASSAIHMTADPTVAGNKSWFATSTFGTVSSRLTNFIPPSFDPSYLIGVYNGNPSSGGVALNQGTSGFEWVFDYVAGVLQFLNGVPSVSNGLYLVAYQYVGTIGLSGSSAPTLTYGQVVQSAGTVSTGTASFAGIFSHAPISTSVEVMVNGISIENSIWSISGTTLNITIGGSGLPYSIENGDIVSVYYAY